MTDFEFDRICMQAVEMVREASPYRTGNLKYNSIQFEYRDDSTFAIYINESIAPYMPFTNEEWVSERWNGKANPNEHWFENVAREVGEMVAREIDGSGSEK